MSGVPQPGSTFGGYRITGTLGHGGMGIVLSALREDLNRQVALKILSPHLADDPEFRDRFIREAAVLSRLYSPHIIDIYDHGEEDGCLYIATPLISSGDLGGLLAERTCLSPREALGIVEQVAAALSDAHGAGIVHRDIKPSNVLLHRSPDGGLFAYLCDFGIARSVDDQSTPTRGLIGTLTYVAPERHLGHPASVATDIYSLGCLLYATLTGRPPYDGTDAQVAFQHLYSPVPQLGAPVEVAPAVDAILQRAMAKRPADRYTSASEMRTDVLDALSSVRADLPGSTMPRPGSDDTLPVAGSTHPLRPSPTVTVGRGRRPVRGWLIALVALVLVAAASASAWSNDSVACSLGLRDADSDQCRDQTADAAGGGTSTDLVTCWNRARVPTKDSCGRPVGLMGLRWMFPSFTREFDSCWVRPDPTPDSSVRSWRCPADDGPEGESITYTEWVSPVAAKAHYAPSFDSRSRELSVDGAPVGYRWWRTRPVDGLVKMSMAYERLPFSTSVYARTLPGLERLCETISARSPTTFRVGSVACDLPDPTDDVDARGPTGGSS